MSGALVPGHNLPLTSAEIFAWVDFERSQAGLHAALAGTKLSKARAQAHLDYWVAIAALLEAGKVDRQRWETLAADAANAGISNTNREYGMRLLANMVDVESRCPHMPLPAPPATSEGT